MRIVSSFGFNVSPQNTRLRRNVTLVPTDASLNQNVHNEEPRLVAGFSVPGSDADSAHLLHTSPIETPRNPVPATRRPTPA